MTDPVSLEWEGIAKFLWGALMTVLTGLGLKKINKVEELENEMIKLKAAVVTLEDLEAFKKEQRNSLGELRESLITTVDFAVSRVEKSNGRVIHNLQETQNLILKTLLEKK